MISEKRKSFLLAASLFIMAALAYFAGLHTGFIWDDDLWVSHNSTLQGLQGLAAIWINPLSDPQYYPLTLSTFWVERCFWGLCTVGYHMDNLLLHGANAVLAWLVLRKLKVPGAFIAAALFAVHPVHVESVVWITERKNILSCFFFLLALLAYLQFEDRQRWSLYGASLLLFLAALLSKTVVCSLPVVLLLIAWWKRGRIQLRELGLLSPFFAIGAGLGLMTAWMEKVHVGASGPEWNFTVADRFLIAGRAIWFYASKLAAPEPIIFVYPRWHLDASSVWQWCFPAGFLLVVGFFWFKRNHLGRGPLVAVLAFAAMLFPALGFFNVYPMRYSFVADHFQYHASLAMLALFGAVLARLPKFARNVSVALTLSVFTALSTVQCGDYKSLETLWRNTLSKNPDAVIAHNNLALILASEHKEAQALVHLGEALRIAPDDYEARTNAGMVFMEIGRPREALIQYKAAIDIDPRFCSAHNGLGSAYATLRDYPKAISEFEGALRLCPRHPGAQYNLGSALVAVGRCEEAIPHLRAAARLSPGYVEAERELVFALHKTGRNEEAAVVERLNAKAR